MFLGHHSKCLLLTGILLLSVSNGICSESCVGTAMFTRRQTGYVHPENVIRSRRVSSPLECGFACRRETDCVSFNLRQEENQSYLCTMNRQRASANQPPSQHMSDSYYEMIEPINNACAESPCENGGTCLESCDRPGYLCRCRPPYYGVNCTKGLGDEPLYVADSCRDIFSVRRGATSQPYYVKSGNSNGYSHVYCHLDNIPGCGDGGWTLVMKIDGNSKNFLFASPLWTNKELFNVSAGLGLELKETKLATFWSTSFSEICLGMTFKCKTRWLKLVHSGRSLYDVISRGNLTETNLTIAAWKSLIEDSSLQIDCTRQGFNVQDPGPSTSARARIGITGFRDSSCSGTSDSRIGFGTSGSMYGMDDNNACGNEARNVADNGNKSLKTFGFIFVK